MYAAKLRRAFELPPKPVPAVCQQGCQADAFLQAVKQGRKQFPNNQVSIPGICAVGLQSMDRNKIFQTDVDVFIQAVGQKIPISQFTEKGNL